MQPEETPAAGQRPIQTFSGSGGLRVAIWKKNSEHGDFYNVKLERRYLGTGDQWQSTDSLRADDLLRAAKMLEDADQWIEQDKQKKRDLREVGRFLALGESSNEPSARNKPTGDSPARARSASVAATFVQWSRVWCLDITAHSLNTRLGQTSCELCIPGECYSSEVP
jgi:hypothetical protein